MILVPSLCFAVSRPRRILRVSCNSVLAGSCSPEEDTREGPDGRVPLNIGGFGPVLARIRGAILLVSNQEMLHHGFVPGPKSAEQAGQTLSKSVVVNHFNGPCK